MSGSWVNIIDDKKIDGIGSVVVVEDLIFLYFWEDIDGDIVLSGSTDGPVDVGEGGEDSLEFGGSEEVVGIDGDVLSGWDECPVHEDDGFTGRVVINDGSLEVVITFIWRDYLIKKKISVNL